MPPRILVTCPPMLGLFNEFVDDFRDRGLEGVPANVTQVMTEDELIAILGEYDGWIIGDDPASRRVLTAGKEGKLRATVKWGVGVDNVDFEACKDLGLPVSNTPGVFGNEVADVATAFVLGLARQVFLIDREIRENNAWPKPVGISLTGRKCGIIGFGDIGRQTARRMAALGFELVVFDPAYAPIDGLKAEHREWTGQLDDLDYLVFTAPLNPATHKMFNHETLDRVMPGVRVVNVGRGPVIDEASLIEGLKSGVVHSAALDVFEVEPLPDDSPLREFPRCIFGSHNGSNSADAVRRVSRTAIGMMAEMLG